MATVAPYGSWRSPIDAATVARAGRRLAAPALAARRRRLVGGRAAGRGRARGADAAPVRWRARRRDAGRVQRPHPRPRVRRRRLDAGRRGPRPLRQLRRPARSTAQRARRGAGRDHAGAGEPPPACATPTSGSAPDGRTVVCVREVHGEGEAENQIVALPARRLRRADGARLAGATSTPSPALSPDGASLAWTCWDHPNMPWDGTELWVAPLGGHGRRDAWSRAARRSRSSSPSGTTKGELHFVSDREGWWNLYRDEGEDGRAADRRGSRARRTRSGSSAASTYAFLADGSIACVRCERGEERALPARARRRAAAATSSCPTPRSASPRCRAAAPRSPSPPPARPGRPPSSSSTCPAASWRRCSEPPRSRSTTRYVSIPQPDRVPDQRRRDRARLLLPADQPRVRGAGGRAAAADRPEPRRPDLARDAGARPRVPLLDQPRLRRRRRQLPRQQRLRPPLPPAPARRAGASSTPRTASPAPRHLAERRRGRRRAAGDPRRQRRRLRHPLRARLPRRLRHRRQLLRRRRHRDARHRHPQVRVALPRRADRALSRASETSTESARRSTSSSGCGSR